MRLTFPYVRQQERFYCLGFGRSTERPVVGGGMSLEVEAPVYAPLSRRDA